MWWHFDLHPKSQRIAISQQDPFGRIDVVIRTMDGLTLGKVSNSYLPLASRWSPDGFQIAFHYNDGLLYLYRLEDAAPADLRLLRVSTGR